MSWRASSRASFGRKGTESVSRRRVTQLHWNEVATSAGSFRCRDNAYALRCSLLPPASHLRDSVAYERFDPFFPAFGIIRSISFPPPRSSVSIFMAERSHISQRMSSKFPQDPAATRGALLVESLRHNSSRLRLSGAGPQYRRCPLSICVGHGSGLVLTAIASSFSS